MKFCAKCGTQLADEAVICPTCGCATGYQQPATNYQQPATNYQQPTNGYQQPMNGYQPPMNVQPQRSASGLSIAAKIIMIISTIVMGIYIIPLAWCLPLTISYCKKVNRGEPISTGFKVCCLIFVNTLAGIFMLCDRH